MAAAIALRLGDTRMAGRTDAQRRTLAGIVDAVVAALERRAIWIGGGGGARRRNRARAARARDDVPGTQNLADRSDARLVGHRRRSADVTGRLLVVRGVAVSPQDIAYGQREGAV